MGDVEKSLPLESLRPPIPTQAKLQPISSAASLNDWKSPTEDSPLFPTANPEPESELSWKRFAALGYHATFVALSIFFLFQLRCTLVPFLWTDCDSEASPNCSTELTLSSAQPISPWDVDPAPVELAPAYYGHLPPGHPRTPQPFLFHVPKTASTYYIELIRMICKETDVYGKILELLETNPGHINYWLSMDSGMVECMNTRFSKNNMWHQPVDGEKYARFPGSFVGMFREPVSRLASGFVHDFHDCNWLMQAYFDCISARRKFRRNKPENNTKSDAWLNDLEGDMLLKCRDLEHPEVHLVQTYFDCVKGCTTNMLNGVSCGDGGYYVSDDGMTMVMINSRPNYIPTYTEMRLAEERLQTHFVTFGIMEEYVESVARLHHIFSGGEPFEEEKMFPNMRPSHDKELKKQVATMMRENGMVDHADERIYKVAKEVFYRRPNITI